MKPLRNGLFFDKAFVITLPERESRLAFFYDELANREQIEEEKNTVFPTPEKIYGVNAPFLGAPTWFPNTPGTWGCRSSHIRAIEIAASLRVERLLVFEDDAALNDGRPHFFDRLNQFLSAVPDDWDFLQLGYRRIGSDWFRNGQFCEGQNIVETHAIAYNGTSFRKIYNLLTSLKPGAGSNWLWPIDVHLNHLGQSGKLKRYLPRNSLIHQNKRFESDIQT